ncbi:MAG: aspartate 1-decarboxylase [Chitinispirillaceae bacterium]|nr:aspartate 1-decarboxylase [Chitinispirillaceae bacterium]
MFRIFLNSKLRDIRITSTNLEYEGSITLDEEYLEKAGILPNEEVHVLNVNTGIRIITYAIAGERGSGIVQLNGPAARLAMVGDKIMVLSYVILSPEEIAKHKPKIVSINPE